MVSWLFVICLGNGMLPDDAKPLSELMLTYLQLGTQEYI